MGVYFEWDEKKDKANQRKHGISFAAASGAFFDEHRKERVDERSADEERWIMIGLVHGEEILVVYTIREETVRLILARGADKHEREEYWDRSH